MHGNIGNYRRHFDPKPRKPTFWEKLWRRILAILKRLFDEAFQASAEWNEIMLAFRGREAKFDRERLWPP